MPEKRKLDDESKNITIKSKIHVTEQMISNVVTYTYGDTSIEVNMDIDNEVTQSKKFTSKCTGPTGPTGCTAPPRSCCNGPLGPRGCIGPRGPTGATGPPS